MIRVLFATPPQDWLDFGPAVAAAGGALGLELEVTDRPGDAEGVDYAVYAPGGAIDDFSPFANLKAVLSLWAGVERIVGNATIRVPLCRMVDPGLAQGMGEYVLGHVLRRHLGMDALAQDGVWRGGAIPPLASERTVGILGLGELGGHCARLLAALGFEVLGWSRRPKAIAGIETFAGETGLVALLRRAEILVTLLPSTPATTDLLDARRLALLPPGASIVNPGRGTVLDDDALLAGLDAGRIGHATLDVFRTEPLPPDHRYWAHPRVTVTPHVSAATRPATASTVIVENIRRSEAGLPLLHLVDRDAGY